MDNAQGGGGRLESAGGLPDCGGDLADDQVNDKTRALKPRSYCIRKPHVRRGVQKSFQR
jgi:hypothetical protein